MSTSKKRAMAVRAPMKKAGKLVAKATAGKREATASGNVAPVAKKVKTAASPDLKAVVRATGKKTAPVAKKPATAAQPKLKLVAATLATKSAAKAPKVVVPRQVQEKVRIFQIYYRPEQRQYLDPAFEPYNNEGDNSPLLEFNVFRKLVNSDLVKGADLWGALSWKFTKKTGLTGEQLRQIIASNPGHDVYYCNPFPELEGLYHNLWLQGETCHPNFLVLSREFLRAAGLEEALLAQLVSSEEFSASNYFIATPTFWKGYMAFVEGAVARAEAHMSSTAREIIYSSTADKKGLHAGASYMPFILERLFSIYLMSAKNRINKYKFPLTQREENMNVHVKLLRQMKDVAVNSRSLWMAACWVNYRNLYMSRINGDAWAERYMKSITPVRIEFK